MTQRICAQHQSLQYTASDHRPGSFAGDLKVLSDTVYSSVSIKHGQATNILRINWSGDETLCNQHPGEFKLCHDEGERLKIDVQHGDEISVTVFSRDGSILQFDSPFTEERFSPACQLNEKFMIRIKVGWFWETIGNHAARALASLPFSPYTKRSKDETVLSWEIKMCGKDGEGTVRARVMRPARDTLPFQVLSFNTSFAVKQFGLREESRTGQARAMDVRQIVSSFEPENIASSSSGSDVATCDEQTRLSFELILSQWWERMNQILAGSGGVVTGTIGPCAGHGAVLLSDVADHRHEIIVDKVRYRLPPGKATPDQIRRFSEHWQVVKKWRDVIYELPRRPEGDESAFNEDDISRFEKSGGHSDAVASAIHEWFKQPQHTTKILYDVLSNEEAGLKLGSWPLKILAVKCDT